MPRRKNTESFLQEKRKKLEADRAAVNRELAILAAQEKEQARKAAMKRRFELGAMLETFGLADIPAEQLRGVFVIAQDILLGSDAPERNGRPMTTLLLAHDASEDR